MAYGQVTLGPCTQGDGGGEYEDLDKVAARSKLGHDQVNYEQVAYSDAYELPGSKPDAPVYSTADDHKTTDDA